MIFVKINKKKSFLLTFGTKMLKTATAHCKVITNIIYMYTYTLRNRWKFRWWGDYIYNVGRSSRGCLHRVADEFLNDLCPCVLYIKSLCTSPKTYPSRPVPSLRHHCTTAAPSLEPSFSPAAGIRQHNVYRFIKKLLVNNCVVYTNSVRGLRVRVRKYTSPTQTYIHTYTYIHCTYNTYFVHNRNGTPYNMTFVFALRAAKQRVHPETKPLPVPPLPLPMTALFLTILLHLPPRYPSTAGHPRITIRDNGFRIGHGASLRFVDHLLCDR